ncbi:MAG: DMT family transporter [Proteobacteria bacterium]|nr:DMT family transporter [Burkholderiales bacterium]
MAAPAQHAPPRSETLVTRRSRRIGLACALAGAVFFSAKAIFIKLIYAYGIDATTTFALRMMIALPFFIALGVWCAARDRSPIARRDWFGMTGCGVLGFYLSSYLDFIGLSYIPASLERLILFLYPTFVVLLSWRVFKTRLDRAQVASLALSYAGVLLVVWQNLQVVGDASALAIGVAFTLTSAFTYACYVVISARIVPRVGSMRFTSYASSIACGFTLAHFFLLRDPAALIAPPTVYVYAVGMATLSTVLPILLVAEALRRLGANQVALISSIGPIATIAMAAIVLGETITGMQMVGAALVIAGVLLVSFRTPVRPA